MPRARPRAAPIQLVSAYTMILTPNRVLSTELNFLFSGVLAGEFPAIFAALAGRPTEKPTEFGRFVPIRIGNIRRVRRLSGVATTTAPTVGPDEPDTSATE